MMQERANEIRQLEMDKARVQDEAKRIQDTQEM
jgi:hypothetical protein